MTQRSQRAAAGGSAPLRLGVVLCGGRSRRMGSDKARLDLEGRSLLERAVEVLRPLGEEVLLAPGAEDRYGELGLARVLDAEPDQGPLAGLVAALEELARRDPEGRLFVLACDMPRARPEVFERLEARLLERDADLCLLSGERGVEPLFAVYQARVLPAARAALAAGERRLVGFHDAVRVARLEEHELPAELGAVARNLNTPAELERERETPRETRCGR